MRTTLVASLPRPCAAGRALPHARQRRRIALQSGYPYRDESVFSGFVRCGAARSRLSAAREILGHARSLERRSLRPAKRAFGQPGLLLADDEHRALGLRHNPVRCRYRQMSRGTRETAWAAYPENDEVRVFSVRNCQDLFSDSTLRHCKLWRTPSLSVGWNHFAQPPLGRCNQLRRTGEITRLRFCDYMQES